MSAPIGWVWAMKSGDYQPTNFSGTQAGYDAAVTYCGSNGVVRVYPGSTSITYGTIPAGVTVIIEDDEGMRVLGYGINIRDAVRDGNGTTDPALYSDKTLALGTATSGQAAKNVDIVSRFTGTSAFTNLSLNGLHAINRYGASGSGGGDVETGMGVGAYSEHRGDAAITGSLYGLEAATTMYNTGSVANAFGTLSTAQITTGSNSTITTARGIQALARGAGSGAGTITTAIAVDAIAGLQNTSSVNITDAIGGRFNCIKDGGVSGSITNATAVKIDTVNQGSTNNFGLRITAAPSGGSNLNQAIRVDAGATYLGGTLAVGGQGTSLPISSILCATATLNFDLSAAVSQDLTITVTGAADGDPVFIGVPAGSVTADTAFFGWVSATNTVTIRAYRLAGTPNPASGTFRATVFHY